MTDSPEDLKIDIPAAQHQTPTPPTQLGQRKKASDRQVPVQQRSSERKAEPRESFHGRQAASVFVPEYHDPKSPYIVRRLCDLDSYC